MRIRIEENTLGRLRLLARDCGVEMAYTYTDTERLRSAILSQIQIEMEMERTSAADMDAIRLDGRHYSVVARERGLSNATVLAIRARRKRA